MFNISKKELDWHGKKLSLESGFMARQADAAVVARLEDTMVLCTVVAEASEDTNMDYLPLSVNYMEKTYAAGRIPGGFFKREGRPSEKEILVSRLIDRPLRPLFAENFYNDTQILCTVLSHDGSNDADILSIIGASAALAISPLPYTSIAAAAKIGLINDEFILNPTIEELEESSLDLVLAGTKNGILMVESQTQELSEEKMLKALNFGHKQILPVITIIEEMRKLCGIEKQMPKARTDDTTKTIEKNIETKFSADIKKAYSIANKSERKTQLNEIKESLNSSFAQDADEEEKSISGICLKELEKTIVREQILSTKKRIDGRKSDDIREIDCVVRILPLAHGSSVFTRGETQALVVTTLGTTQDEQIIDALSGEYRQNFLLHYNFPPYSVGETGRTGAVGRREIGHGKLAWRAIKPVLPDKEDFPYTIRVVSEITESNGSSSMATVCGSSLSLMDAGVGIKPVAGIAMGLIKEGDDYIVLSDIIGDEDHLGDMDFKVAGTKDGITALQMDIKIEGVSEEIMNKALRQALSGRLYILEKMNAALASARKEINRLAPRIETIKISPEKIGGVIGSGGKIIRDIRDKSGTRIDIEDDGTIRIAAAQKENIDKAIGIIRGLTAEPEVGKIYQGKVVKCLDFGAFVNFLGERDGLVHISELANYRVAHTTDIVNEGDMVKVKVLGFDDRGKVRLSMKAVQNDEKKASISR